MLAREARVAVPRAMQRSIRVRDLVACPIPEVSLLDWAAVQMPRSHVVTSLPGPGPNFISRVSHNVLAAIADMIRNAVAGNPQPVRKRLLLCTPGPARHARSHGSAAGGFPKAGGKPPTKLRLQTAESQRAQ